jgi:hypothetical protein
MPRGTESGMKHRSARLAAGLFGGFVAGAALASTAFAGETPLRPEEAKRFVANKLFSYTCFDGTSGAGRIHADGSVVGTMQASGGRERFVALPSGTVRLTGDSICAYLPHALFQPCFNVVQTSPQSFRGSLKGLGFAYCDFVRRNPRLEITRTNARQQHPQPIESAIALRPSRY